MKDLACEDDEDLNNESKIIMKTTRVTMAKKNLRDLALASEGLSM